MNKVMRTISAVLATLLLLTACNRTSDQSTVDSPQVTTVSASQQSSTSSTVTTAIPETTPPQTLPPETQPPQEEPVTYPAWEGRDDVELLAALDTQLGDVMSVSQNGDRLLISYMLASFEGEGVQKAYAQVLHLTTGKLSEPIELSDSNRIAVFLENGNVCVYDEYNCIAEVYDPDGKKQYTFVNQDNSGAFYLDPSEGGTLWSYSWDSPVLMKIPLAGDPVKKIDLPITDGGYIMGHRDDVLYYSSWNGGDECVFAITKEGDVSYLSEAKGFYWGGNCFFTDSAPNCILNPNDPDSFYQINSDSVFSWVATGMESRLLVEFYDESDGEDYVEYEYRVLDYEKGVYSPVLSVDGQQFCNHFILADEGVLYFLVGCYNEDGILAEAELCRWSYCHDEQSVEVEKSSFESLEPSISAVAERIEEKWGIKVFYQPELIHLVASDYSPAAVTDLHLLYRHILQLEEALSAYPDGFFQDLCYENYTHLELYLCGEFTPLTSDGITTAEALSNTRDSALVIGFNVHYLDGAYVRVLAHELSHIMEKRIDQIDFDILTQWMELTPGGYDAYYFSYHHANGEEMNDYTHTYYYEDDPDDVYFIDAYSKSFPTEDRARIFEKLMESEGDPYFADSPVLMAKARLLCKIIRENFPSVAAVERAAWEVE